MTTTSPSMPAPARVAAILAMAAVVLASNILVQYPVPGALGGIDLADLLTFGAFTYPFAFLVTDLTNRQFGARPARSIVWVGFAAAVVLSLILASPRIALASGAAFLVGQLLDIGVFNRLRRLSWWLAPFAASVLGSVCDTAVFFTLAFAPIPETIAASDPFAVEVVPLLGALSVEAARWVSWAIADLTVKLGFAVLLLAPYRIAMGVLGRPQAAVAA